MKKISKILIANRGEIALRLIRAAKEMHILTVAVYPEIDRNSLHVRMADECYLLKKVEKEPYLDIEQIIEVAKLSRADAIHPGYGFLSENATFAKLVNQSNVIFIGPSHHSIELMGDKLKAKELAEQTGVPIIPGFQIEDAHDTEQLITLCGAVGYPILIKARAGGGGKGMRLVRSESHLLESIERATSEAKDAFGDGSVFVEKFIENPRHIEIQVLADLHGDTTYLFERECSIQRRHQKVIEESPSIAVDEALRKKMGECAVQLAKACGYTNAGTVEFIVDDSKKFYFLEMNTRLQVEHPVTEYITGIDLVKQQIKIAQGHPLDFEQEDLKIVGHAIELRVYAEDPENDFLPDVGTLKRYRTPKGIGVRVDDGYEEDMEIPIEYDPLIAKLVVFGHDRTEAISRMKRAIEEYQIDGVKNTLSFGRKVMMDSDFVRGNFDTNFVAQKSEKFGLGEVDEEEMIVVAMLGHKVFSDDSSIRFKNLSNCQSNWRERLK